MSFKNINRHVNWLEYCNKNARNIAFIGLESKIFESEKKFREYVTYGTVNGKSEGLQKIDEIEDEKFWKLFEFSTNYFDMDGILFEEIEKSRLKR